MSTHAHIETIAAACIVADAHPDRLLRWSAVAPQLDAVIERVLARRLTQLPDDQRGELRLAVALARALARLGAAERPITASALYGEMQAEPTAAGRLAGEAQVSASDAATVVGRVHVLERVTDPTRAAELVTSTLGELLMPSLGAAMAAAAASAKPAAERIAEIEALTLRASAGMQVDSRASARRRWSSLVDAATDTSRPARRVVPTGFGPLDEALGGGLGVGDMTVVGAATGAGKSQLAGALCRNVLWTAAADALPSGPDAWAAAMRSRVDSPPGAVRVLVISTELAASVYMTRWQQDLLHATSSEIAEPTELARRLSSSIGRAMIERLRDQQVVEIADRQTLAEIYRCDGRQLHAIEGYVRAWAREQREQAAARDESEPGLLVVVDHLQRVELPEAVAAKMPRVGQVARVSRALTDLAASERVALAALAQLNGRLGHQSAEECSIRECADVEHDAAAVVILDRLDERLQVAALRRVLGPDIQLDLAAATMRCSIAKGRHSGCADDVMLFADLAYGRITCMRADQLAAIEAMGGDPLVWARDQLPRGKSRRKSERLVLDETPWPPAAE
jgi:replicative DNA helicase